MKRLTVLLTVVGAMLTMPALTTSATDISSAAKKITRGQIIQACRVPKSYNECMALACNKYATTPWSREREGRCGGFKTSQR